MGSVDKRVVQMEFDNQQFESRVQTSIHSLDNLKKGLNLEESAKSLSNLNAAGRSFSLAGISEGVNGLSVKVSALGVMAVTTLANITNSAINAGKRIMESLTVEPVMEGLNNYETKINAIQTILANTSSKGTTLNDVTKSLAELNTYANQTVYNFADMTKNIGTFTAAGVDLKTSVSSIKGIANLAAMSGSSSMQASTAMYQLSQAIATGTVKLMDWNSVVNAGIGGTQFQEALKRTARVHGVAIDDIIKKEGSFRDSLQKGWLTSQILTETLNQYTGDLSASQLKTMGYTDAETKSILAQGKMANDSATKIRTLTQMGQALKEEVGTAWATVWEDLVGNITEATDTLSAAHTALENFLTNGVYGLDALLKQWDKLGGRATIIKSLSNAFDDFQAVIKPVKEAFSEIFPPMTGAQLLNITKGLEILTEKLKIGSTESANLKRTFAGFFAVLDIGKQIFTTVAKGLAGIVSYVAPAGSGILGFTGSIGDSLVAFDQFIKKSNAFNNALQAIGTFLKPIADGVKNFVSTVIDTFKSFAEADLSGLDSFSDRVQQRFSPLTKLGDMIKDAFDGIAKIIQKIAPIFYAIASKVGDAMNQFHQNIANGISKGSFSGILDLVNGGLFSAILVGITKFTKSLNGLVKDAKGSIHGITEILDGVKDCLKAYQKQIQAGTILKIAIAIGILAESLLTLSLIDSAKLAASMAAMTGLFVELFGSMGTFEKIMGSASFKNLGKVTRSMVTMSVAVLILSDAMTKLAKLDWSGVAKGLTGVAGLMLILTNAAQDMSNNSKKMIKGASNLVIMAAAIEILSDAVKRLGSLDLGVLAKGLVSVGLMIAALSAFISKTDFKGMDSFKGLGLIALAVAIDVLSQATKRFASLDPESLIKGLTSIVLILAGLSAFVDNTTDAEHMISIGVGLIALSAAMLILSKAVESMGKMSWEEIGKGLLTLAGSLEIISAAVSFMPPTLPLIGVGLIAVSAALLLLSVALKSMGGMSWEQIAKGLVALAGSMVIIAVATTAMIAALPGAAALLVVAGALAILAPVLKVLGSMSIGDIGKSLLALVGVFTVLGVAGLVLGPVTPILLALDAAIALLGVGCLAVGAGLLAFSAGLSALAVSGAAGAAALVLVITTIAGLIPAIATQIVNGIVTFAQAIGNGAPTIATAVIAVVNSIANVIVSTAPNVVNALTTLLTSLLQGITNFMPQMVQAGMTIIINFLQGVANNIQKVTETAIQIMINFIEGIAAKVPDLIQAGYDLIISFIEGLAKAIKKNTPRLITAIDDLMKALINAAIMVLTHGIGDFKDIGDKVMNNGFIKGVKGAFDGLKNIGKNIVNGLINGVKEKFNDLKNMGTSIGNNLINATKAILGIHSPSKEFQKLGQYTIEGLILGLQSMRTGLQSTTETVINGGILIPAKEMATTMASLATFGATAIANYKQKLYEETDQYKTDTKALTDHQKALSDLQTKRKQVADELNANLKSNSKASKDRVSELRTQLATVDSSISSTTKQIIQDQNDIATHTQDTFDKLKTSISDSVKSTIDPLKVSIDSQVDLFTKFGSDTKVTVSDILTNMQSQVTGVEDWNAQLDALAKRGFATGLLDKLRAMGPTGAGYVAAFASMTTDQMNKANDLFLQSSEITSQTLLTNFQSSMDKATEWSKDLGELAVKGLNQGMIESLGNAGISSENYVKAFLTMTPDQIEQFNTEYANYLKLPSSVSDQVIASFAYAGTSAASSLAKAIGNNKDVVTSAQSLGDATYNGIKNSLTPDKCKSIGSNICSGLCNGLNSGKSNVIATAASVAAAALQAAKDALGVHSPSKAFAEVGMYSDQGLAAGLKNFSGVVVSEAKSLGDTAIDTLKGAVSQVADLVSGNVEMNPTIRPVVDLTDVKTGANTISSLLSNQGINVSAITDKATAISANVKIQNGNSQQSDTQSVPVQQNFNFEQNNYSPTALSRIDIYRQTNNQFSQLKGALASV